MLLARYGQGLHFIIAGDYNRLDIRPILNLSPSLSQLVTIPTRTNPDATLDKIISTLRKYYLPPTSLPPLDNDVEGIGKPSDHLIIVMRPISQQSNLKPEVKVINYRPLPESGMLIYKQWLLSEDWSELYQIETAHEKADYLHSKLMLALDKFLPLKTLKLRQDDQPWVTKEIKDLDRRCKREYSKNKKSVKWKSLNEEFKRKCAKGKTDYSKNIVNDLKLSNPSQWYSKIKRMSSQERESEIIVQELVGMSPKLQAKKLQINFLGFPTSTSP